MINNHAFDCVVLNNYQPNTLTFAQPSGKLTISIEQYLFRSGMMMLCKHTSSSSTQLKFQQFFCKIHAYYRWWDSIPTSWAKSFDEFKRNHLTWDPSISLSDDCIVPGKINHLTCICTVCCNWNSFDEMIIYHNNIVLCNYKIQNIFIVS